jgi:hypothetical protein
VGKHKTDEGWVGPLYNTTDPVAASQLQTLLEDRGIPAMMQTRAWGNLPAASIRMLQPTVYQVLISSADLETHRAEVEAAVAQVREELGQGSEVD